LLNELSSRFHISSIKKVETAKIDEKEVYLFDEVVEFISDENGIYPFLGGNYTDSLPKVVVDMGAVRFVCNGADIMAPGIIEMDELRKGDLVVIRDVTHGKALAIGIANSSSSDIRSTRKGKVVKNIHYVGDKIWDVAS
jgi:PUA domain protein